ncbi:hypothetical protein CEXT_744721 [Caerostris extrusa]|uniref:Uncharacterized protein n=1 Tax=Caerostris extrusa TaxID=172846 RepID=A0AAV4WFD3_CAEEX|nr:hypothetical protein CEXT_744721 [Caerostris extrusa]
MQLKEINLENFRKYFAYEKIKYLDSHWIAPKGLKVDAAKVEAIVGKSNTTVDMLSRPICDTEVNNRENCNFVRIDMPTRNSSSIHEAQMSDAKKKDCKEENNLFLKIIKGKKFVLIG